MFTPKFGITPTIAKSLMEIEACRQTITALPLTVSMLDSFCRTARLLSTHYSTQIEGNRLTAPQVKEVLESGGRFPGRERDEAEVRHYYEALKFVTEQSKKKGPLHEQVLRTVHGLIWSGKETPTAYRDGQNVIKDGHTGRIVYLPPEAKDVPALMRDLVLWINIELQKAEWPAPVIAGLAHYQCATIHPYYDGNGRTARLLTNLILHRGGYGLHGIYSLEEYYAKNLQGYYDALAAGVSHNYYEGRVDADVTQFLTYFVVGMAESFSKIRSHAERAQSNNAPDWTSLLRELTPQQQKALSLFTRRKTVASRDIARFFRISTRSASALCRTWKDTGFLVTIDPSKKARRYQLAEEYEKLMEPGTPSGRIS